MGKFAGIDLSIQAYDGTTEVHGNLFEQAVSYSHEIRAVAGYYSAQLRLANCDADCDDWFDNGLNRRIVVYNDALVPIWVGFVNKVTIDEGNVIRTRGPIIRIVNRVNVKYTKVYRDTSIPLVGVGDETGWIDDLASQADYGIVEKIVNTDERTETEAEQIANYYLIEHAYPEKTTIVQSGATRPTIITLELKGYWHWLFYLYNDIAGTDSETISEKIQSVLSADPNSYISTDFGYIAVNTTEVTEYEDRDRSAQSIIESMIMTSDNVFDRYTFGIYNDQIAHYAKIPSNSTPLYSYDRGNYTITDRNGNFVDPWNIRPAQWLITTGRRGGVGALRPDGYSSAYPETIFIESVQFTASNSFKINGGKVLDIRQGLARLGLEGTGL